ncbi:MAG: Ig-like domain-containing protein [Deltaproteobacteria bacterium]|nr:Ig-like domain-containing protein [Deltaproteobacteria bacterium]
MHEITRCRWLSGSGAAPATLILLAFIATACGRTSLGPEGDVGGPGGLDEGGEGGFFAGGGAPGTGGFGARGGTGGSGARGGAGGGVVVGGRGGLGGAGGSVAGKLVIDPASSSVTVGQSVQLRVSLAFPDAPSRDVTNMATWFVESMIAATVPNRPGRITGVLVGEARVVAEFMGQKATATVRVTADTLTALSLRPTETTINTAGVVQFFALGIFASGQQRDVTADVTWTSTAPEVAAVNHLDVPGLALGQAVGTAKILAKMSGQEAAAVINVTQDARLSLVLEPPDAARRVGETVSFRATALFNDGTQRNVTNAGVWLATNPLVATVERGQATCRGIGETMVVASFDGFSTSGTLTCRDLTVALLRLTPVETEVPRGTRLQYTATAFFSDGTSRIVTDQTRFSSLDTAVVAVMSRGQATAVSAGKATISGVFDGVTGTATITVF